MQKDMPKQVQKYQDPNSQKLRYQLKQKGINQSWKILREIMSTQCRVTSTLSLEDSRKVNIRKTSKANAEQMVIYNALNINSIPGKTQKVYF